jgi:hypothetical protein
LSVEFSLSPELLGGGNVDGEICKVQDDHWMALHSVMEALRIYLRSGSVEVVPKTVRDHGDPIFLATSGLGGRGGGGVTQQALTSNVMGCLSTDVVCEIEGLTEMIFLGGLSTTYA